MITNLMVESMEAIHAVLKDIQGRFADARVQVCRLEAAGVANDTITLQGEVLDRETLAAVESELATRFPGVTIDSSELEVLRVANPCYLTVSSNIVELYEGPSFLAARSSTLLNGTVGELLKEDGRWVFVRLSDGYLGWLYRPYLSEFKAQDAPRLTHLVRVPFSILREHASGDASPVTRVLAGSYATLESAENGWAEISLAGGLTGYVMLADLCALEALPVGEERRAQIVHDAFQYVGVPYLWGGGSVLGIDCSGFAQLLHRLAGVNIPRDADMQYATGRPVERPFQPGDLLFFGGKGSHREISHVGISLGENGRLGDWRLRPETQSEGLRGWGMIHASRSRNGVYVDDVAAVESLRDSFVGARSFL
jgi:SH3-like domain-containing protein